jgi:hypothetical protein
VQTSLDLVPLRLDRPRQAISRQARTFYQSFFIVLVANISPFRALAYIAPFAALVWYLIRARDRRALRNTYYVTVGFAVTIALWSWASSSFVVTNALVATVTYGWIVLVSSVPVLQLTEALLRDKIVTLMARVIAVEGIVGIAQAAWGFAQTGTFDLANGDWVKGTMGIGPGGIFPGRDFANPIFAVFMALALLGLLPELGRRKHRLAFVLGAVALLLAAVLHVTLLTLGALLASTLINRPSRIARSAAVFVAAASIAMLIMPTNVSSLTQYYPLLSGEHTPRTLMVRRAVVEMPRDYPLLPLVGLGPGQFTSRAGLVSTGLYLGGPLDGRSLPLVSTSITPPQRQHLMDLLLASADFESYGSTFKPYFSWLSVYTEFGLPALIAIFGWAGFMILKIRTRFGGSATGIAVGAAILLLLFLGVQENYWEVPQAVLTGALVAKVNYASQLRKLTVGQRQGRRPSDRR